MNSSAQFGIALLWKDEVGTEVIECDVHGFALMERRVQRMTMDLRIWVRHFGLRGPLPDCARIELDRGGTFGV